jgi:hypothetical protein
MAAKVKLLKKLKDNFLPMQGGYARVATQVSIYNSITIYYLKVFGGGGAGEGAFFQKRPLPPHFF